MAPRQFSDERLVQLVKFCFALCCEHGYTEIAEQLAIVITAHKHVADEARKKAQLLEKSREAVRIAAEQGIAERIAIQTLCQLGRREGYPPLYPR
jgi:hypothetical protein